VEPEVSILVCLHGMIPNLHLILGWEKSVFIFDRRGCYRVLFVNLCLVRYMDYGLGRHLVKCEKQGKEY